MKAIKPVSGVVLRGRIRKRLWISRKPFSAEVLVMFEAVSFVLQRWSRSIVH